MKDAICLAGHVSPVADDAHLTGSFNHERCPVCGNLVYGIRDERLNAKWVRDNVNRSRLAKPTRSLSQIFG
jgi:hypothetical protein